MLIRGVETRIPAFKICLVIMEELDPVRDHSKIPLKVLLIHKIRSFYHFSILELGTFEMSQEYEELCVDRSLKPELKSICRIIVCQKVAI